jgi:hypothetical protein
VVAAGAAEPEWAGLPAGLDVGRLGADPEREAFYLRRFADSTGRLLVRDRPAGRLLPPITVSKLAIKDFYTTVNDDGTLDGRMEELLGKVEGEAAQLLKLLLSPYRRPGQLTAAERTTLCQFIAFQMVRGPRKRREMELEADYTIKLQAGDQLTKRDLWEITAVPHPNEHIRLMGPPFLSDLSLPHAPTSADSANRRPAVRNVR